jgi:hypothetical protein
MLNNKWFSLIELWITLAIMWVIATSALSVFQFYQKVIEKTKSETISRIVNETLFSSSVWRWFDTKRVKSNVLLFRNNSDYIDNYYYTEVYKINDVTWIQDSNPTIEFLWFQRIQLPPEVNIQFNNSINWVTLTTDITDNTQILWIRYNLPQGDISIFDASGIYFQRVLPEDSVLLDETNTFWKWIKSLYRWRNIDNTYYYDVIKWTTLSFINNAEIKFSINQKDLWKINVSQETQEFRYVE